LALGDHIPGFGGTNGGRHGAFLAQLFCRVLGRFSTRGFQKHGKKLKKTTGAHQKSKTIYFWDFLILNPPPHSPIHSNIETQSIHFK
jgi:hypothetical protein